MFRLLDILISVYTHVRVMSIYWVEPRTDLTNRVIFTIITSKHKHVRPPLPHTQPPISLHTSACVCDAHNRLPMTSRHEIIFKDLNADGARRKEERKCD